MIVNGCKFCGGNCRHFPCNARHAQAISAIGRQLERKNVILKLVVTAKIQTDGCITGKQEETLAPRPPGPAPSLNIAFRQIPHLVLPSG